ncbi:hypothetical protein Tco_0717570, partial [Tanacetum coccineum]
EFQDTAKSREKKETKGMVFYQMETEEVSDRFMAPCFVNRLEAYDGEINLGVEENMILNKYAWRNLFVKFIINPEEDDVKPRVIFGRSFLRMTKAITDFGAGIIIIYPDINPLLEETKEEEKSIDDWDHLLDFNIDYIPLLGTSSSVGGHLTPEEAAKEELAIRMCRKFALLEEERPIIETMAYHDKYKKILYKVWKDKIELDGKIIKEEEEAVKRIKGEALKEIDDPREFIFPIRLEGHVNQNALTNIGSDINTMPFWVTTMIAKFLILDILIDRDSPIVVGRGFLRTIGGIVNTPKRLFLTFDGFCHQTFRATRFDVMRNARK